MLGRKIEETLIAIEKTLECYRAPALMVSFGKDSMVLLHLLRHLNLPVICHRPPWQPKKWWFAEKIIRDYDLTVFDWPPEWVALQEKDGQLELVTAYTIGGSSPMGLRQKVFQVDQEPQVCGLHDCLRRPKGTMEHPWDLLVCAQKNGDTDHFGGQLEVPMDVKQCNGADSYFPLRNWTDQDVLGYIHGQDVPINSSRYNPGLTDEERRDADVDSVEGCFACLMKDKPAYVPCPRLHGQVINNIANQVPYLKHETSI